MNGPPSKCPKGQRACSGGQQNSAPLLSALPCSQPINAAQTDGRQPTGKPTTADPPPGAATTIHPHLPIEGFPNPGTGFQFAAVNAHNNEPRPSGQRKPRGQRRTSGIKLRTPNVRLCRMLRRISPHGCHWQPARVWRGVAWFIPEARRGGSQARLPTRRTSGRHWRRACLPARPRESVPRGRTPALTVH